MTAPVPENPQGNGQKGRTIDSEQKTNPLSPMSDPTSWSTPLATPNQPLSSIVFTSGSTVTIQAPKELVWDILLDWERYGEWNTWAPKFEFEEGTKIQPGAMGKMFVHMEKQKKDYVIPEKILIVEDTITKSTLAWAGLLLPSWAGKAERVQELTPSEDGRSCTLKQWESMSGWSTYLMKYLMKVDKELDESNIKYSRDLKKIAEQRYKSDQMS